MAAGERPDDVRIVDKVTGEVTPCELAYEGIDENGVGVWVVSEDNKFDPLRQLIRVGRLPGAVLPERGRRGRRLAAGNSDRGEPAL